jgi:hypothetical protein
VLGVSGSLYIQFFSRNSELDTDHVGYELLISIHIHIINLILSRFEYSTDIKCSDSDIDYLYRIGRC